MSGVPALCDRSLVQALDPGWLGLWLRAGIPVLGGIAAGWWVAPGLEAMVAGLGVSTLGLLALHVLGLEPGWVYGLWSLACLGLFAWALRSRGGLGVSPRFSRAELWVALAASPLAVHLVGGPMPFGDSIAIWTFHGKALVCDSLWRAPFTREAVWTGTHPEYPLLMSLMHAWTFWASDSFRDDAVRLWVAALLVVSAVGAWRVLLRVTGRKVWAAAAVGMLLAFQGGQVADGRVEDVAMLLGGWTVLLAWEGRWRALPWAIFGMGMTKNEGWVAAAVLTALLAAFGNRKSGDFRRALWLTGGLLVFWLCVQLQLPSRHEQYPSRLTSLAAWVQGVRGLPTILKGTGVRFIHFPWAPIAWGFAWIGFLRWEDRARRWKANPLARPLGLGVAVMLGVFLGIYVVTPWGPLLYQITWDRLLAALSLRGGWLLLLLLASAAPRFPRTVRATGVLLCAIYALSGLERSVGLGWDDIRRWRKGETGIEAYRAVAQWQRAFAVDPRLPPRAVGVLVDDVLLDMNYMLGPRRLYPALPEVVAQTAAPWREFRTGDALPTRALCAIGARWRVTGTAVEPLACPASR